MSIDRFTVSNYRAFTSVSVEVQPLTLLFGYNSAGKSALMRWLPTLSDTLKQSGHAPINMNSPALRGMSFQNLLSTYASSSALSFSLVGEKFEFEFVVRDLADQRKQIIESLKIFENGTPIGTLRWAALSERLATYFLETSEGVEEVEANFAGLLPTTLGSGPIDMSVAI